MIQIFLQRIKLTIFLFLLLNGLAGFSIYKLETMIQNKDKEIKEYLSELERKSRGSQNLKEALEQARNTKVIISGFEKYLFKSGNELNLITDLENIAQTNKVTQKIESSNLDKIVNNTIFLTLRISGTYTDTLNYLMDLENYDYFLQIKTLDFNPVYDLKNPESPEGARTDLRLTLNLYVNP